MRRTILTALLGLSLLTGCTATQIDDAPPAWDRCERKPGHFVYHHRDTGTFWCISL